MTTSRRQFLRRSVGAAALLSASGIDAIAAPGSKAGQFLKFDNSARRVLATLALEEKIGQMTQPDEGSLVLDDIERYHLGSVLCGGDTDPKAGNSLTAWTDLYDTCQEHALRAKPRIPLLFGVDTVHGHNNVLGAVIFPHHIGLGCTRNAALVERAARVTSQEVRATGINWGFAPCVTVPQDIRWGRTYEGYSESPDIVKVLGPAAVRGLQRDNLADPLAILASAKHYAGDGGTAFGTGIPDKNHPGLRAPLDQGDTRVDEATLRRIHLPGYVTTVAAGVGTIMPSYSSWNGVKCSASKRLLTAILKREFGFHGFLISDYNALQEIPGTFKDQIATSINAGMDMVMITEQYREYMSTLAALVREGRVPMSRIDDAVVRILRVKFAAGLMDDGRSPLADRALHKTFGSVAHRAVARQCVRESLVLLKNDHGALPIKKSAHVHVAGKSADNLGYQCGGWTITWQGGSGDVTPGGTTILAAIRKAVAPGTQVTYSRDGSGAAGDVAIAVVGEVSYAEMMGDRYEINLAQEDAAVIDNLKSRGIPVVVVLVSGRPLMIDSILAKADAIVAAWLPGTEGDGVADVLFGDSKPVGKLSFTWPRGDSTTLHLGDPGYRTLFPLGHGLTYS
jgi:beta-glucosidase